jgi:cobalt-zinc-cadmium efflux system membrane fusion protein
MKIMKKSIQLTSTAAAVVATVAVIVLAAVFLKSGSSQSANATPLPGVASNAVPPEPTMELTPNQLSTLTIAPIGTYVFPVEKEAVGYIDFDDNLSVQVFPNWQGKLLKTFVEIGDDVKNGQPLYTIDSPDLVNAENNLIGAVAANILYSNELVRAKHLYGTNGVAQRELEQATSDANTAEGAYLAAHDAVRVFGKTEDEINRIESTRQIDPALVVRSPIKGRITAMNAPPGYLVQPGNPPAPYSVADLSMKWMFGNVMESDVAAYREGQTVEVKSMAYPGRVFSGKINKIYETVDPNVHTMLVRSEVSDPTNELRPGMLANFVIQVGQPVEATAIPTTGVTRESDGSFTTWVTSDRRHFTQRILKIGMQSGGMDQVLEGVQRGDLVVAKGAVFLSNLLDLPPE